MQDNVMCQDHIWENKALDPHMEPPMLDRGEPTVEGGIMAQHRADSEASGPRRGRLSSLLIGKDSATQPQQKQWCGCYVQISSVFMGMQTYICHKCNSGHTTQFPVL